MYTTESKGNMLFSIFFFIWSSVWKIFKWLCSFENQTIHPKHCYFLYYNIL